MNEYIITQGPLRTTMDEFWCLMWEQRSTVIVMMTKLFEGGNEKVFQVTGVAPAVVPILTVTPLSVR